MAWVVCVAVMAQMQVAHGLEIPEQQSCIGVAQQKIEPGKFVIPADNRSVNRLVGDNLAAIDRRKIDDCRQPERYGAVKSRQSRAGDGQRNARRHRQRDPIGDSAFGMLEQEFRANGAIPALMIVAGHRDESDMNALSMRALLNSAYYFIGSTASS